MNIKNNPRLQQLLAAEYVLGTLRGGARRRFDYWLQQEPFLQQIVREWRERLMPMVEFSSASQPSPQVWSMLEKNLKLKTQNSGREIFDFINRINFWRGLSLIASAAMIMLAVLVLKPNDLNSPTMNYVATLIDDKAQAVAVISSDRKQAQLVLHFVELPKIADNQSLELWSISKEGKVRSLGVVSSQDSQKVLRIALPKEVSFDTPQLLAISLEPKGGSGNSEKPSGPILYKGNWLKMA